MRRENRKIKDKWMKHAPNLYWGDDVDVRYYLAKEMRKLRGKKILDVGCGPGILLSEMSNENEAYGIDSNNQTLKIAKEVAPSAHLIPGNMLNLPFEDKAFDVVVAAHVLPGVDFRIEPPEREKQRKMLRNIHRVLREDGTLLLTTPNGGHPYYWKKHKINYEELQSLLQPFFTFDIYGYDPFPIPSRLLAWLPFMEDFLEFLMRFSFLKKTGRHFFVRAKKRTG